MAATSYAPHVSGDGVRLQLLDALRQARQREQTLVELCVDEPVPPDGRWRASDHIAHLIWWRRHAAELVEAASRGEAYAEVLDIDGQNARTYAANRDRPASDIIAGATASYDALIHAVERASEEALLQARSGRPGPVWQAVTGNGHDHVGEHLMQWQLEQGDASGAEATATWVYETDSRLPLGQALAAYNLACFYAKTGRAADAVPFLTQSLELDPGLKEWAREDSDLAPIRDQPDVASLLAS